MACHNEIEEGIRLQEYFTWSPFINFELADRYSQRFKLNYINHNMPE
jgi:beta-glucosidase/6-phospho-beta-glucosidase/beta-galactosidase